MFIELLSKNTPSNVSLATVVFGASVRQWARGGSFHQRPHFPGIRWCHSWISFVLINFQTILFAFFSDDISTSTQRLLVDWLCLLDPELITSYPTAQQTLLFGASGQSERTESSTRSCQAYLLALLTHQSNWTSLHNCVTLLLKHKSASRYLV